MATRTLCSNLHAQCTRKGSELARGVLLLSLFNLLTVESKNCALLPISSNIYLRYGSHVGIFPLYMYHDKMLSQFIILTTKVQITLYPVSPLPAIHSLPQWLLEKKKKKGKKYLKYAYICKIAPKCEGQFSKVH